MKRYFAVFLSLVVLLSGCSSKETAATWTQRKALKEIEPYAQKAIEIIDGYLAFELTADEATNEFESLYQRIEPYDIRGTDSTYSDPDKTISYVLDSLAIFDADKKTDIEYHQYRDILAFQIGEDVSGKKYDAAQMGIDNCVRLAELVNIDAFPFDSAMEYEYNGYWTWGLTFDEMNGISPSDLQKYIETIISKLQETDIKNYSFNFSYNCYEQDVFTIAFVFADGELHGSVQRSGEEVMQAYDQLFAKYTSEEISAMEKMPKEFSLLDPLYEFTSMEQLPEAISAASAFAGVE